MDRKEDKKAGVYVSNFFALAIAFFVLVLAVATGFFAKSYFDGLNSKPAPGAKTVTDANPVNDSVTISQVKDAFNKSAIKFGGTDKKVVFLEASDPSCPYCSIASGQNNELNKEAGDRFKLVQDGGTYEAPVVEIKKLVDSGKASYALIYRNGHGAGEMAMKAFYCAFEQGKFWEAHDLIMGSAGYNLVNNTVKNDKSKINELVNFLSGKLDVNQLKTCLESGKYDGRLQEDTKIGDSLGFGGTPGFYVNAKLFAGAYSFSEMRSGIEALIK